MILAGGGGTRLWPKSRQLFPKQFLKFGEEKTLLQETCSRVDFWLAKENIYVVTTKEQLAEVKKQLPEVPAQNILVEPFGKNTAPSIGLAILTIANKNPNAVIGSFASDHLIKDKEEFLKVIGTCFLQATYSDDIVTVGIPPTKADEGLGYIHIGKQLETVERRPVFSVKSFVEKPDLTLAKAFVASGEYFWNASYFIASAQTFISAYKQFLPKVWEILEKMVKVSPVEKEKLWRGLPAIAIDYGIMEKAKNLVMITGDFGWSDLGSWSVLFEVSPKSVNGNVFLGETGGKHVGIDTKDCLIYSDDRLIATIGVSDLVVVESADAILIASKNRAQEVKKIVEKLKSEEKNEYI